MVAFGPSALKRDLRAVGLRICQSTISVGERTRTFWVWCGWPAPIAATCSAPARTTAGNVPPFDSRITDTLGTRYGLGTRAQVGDQSPERVSDPANTEAESASACIGRIPDYA
jgi:hypothetical protein